METQFVIKIFGKTFVFKSDWFIAAEEEESPDSRGSNDLVAADSSDTDFSTQPDPDETKHDDCGDGVLIDASAPVIAKKRKTGFTPNP